VTQPATVSDEFLHSSGAEEWLVATGRGGYALGTTSGTALRRYHGWLVVALPPPHGRTMIWPRVEELLVAREGGVGLVEHWWGDGVRAPETPARVSSFARLPEPTWILKAGEHRVRRRLRMSDAGDGAWLLWDLLDGPDVDLLVRPLLTWRSHHHLLQGEVFDPQVVSSASGLTWCRSPGLPEVSVAFSGEVADAAGHLYAGGHLPVESARGYDSHEDLHAPAQVRFSLRRDGPSAWMCVSAAAAGPPPELPTGAEGARSFVVRHPDGRDGIIAGYPWFTEWARDTMIALPGLLLPDRAETAGAILSAWADRVEHGLLPNQLRDLGSGPLRTNSADAPLLLVRAAERLMEVAPDAVPAAVVSAIGGIVDAYAAGTEHGIGVDADGLLCAGVDGHALTWMDAITLEGPVTPRHGRPVELNALWISALRFASRLAILDGDDARADHLSGAADQATHSFAERFVDPGTGRMLDVVSPEEESDPKALRPNLLWALALDPCPVAPRVAAANLELVEAELVTPYGLRTLSPEHPDYVGCYGGDQATRDRAYHQGTVWPWLMGPYVDAVLAVRGDTAEVREALVRKLSTLRGTLDRSGSLPEVYDGDPPHRPGGCPAQAWSVAEVQRALRRLGE